MPEQFEPLAGEEAKAARRLRWLLAGMAAMTLALALLAARVL